MVNSGTITDNHKEKIRKISIEADNIVIFTISSRYIYQLTARVNNSMDLSNREDIILKLLAGGN